MAFPWRNPGVLEGKVVFLEDMPPKVIHLLNTQGWLPFLTSKAPTFPDFVQQFYNTLKPASLKTIPHLLPLKLLSATVENTEIIASASLLSQLFSLSRDGVKIYTINTWIEETDFFQIGDCLRFLYQIPEEKYTEYNKNLPPPSVQRLSTNNTILLYIIRENILPTPYKSQTLNQLECILLYLLNKEVHIDLPHLILKHMERCKNQLHKPYGMILTQIFRHNLVPIPVVDHEPRLMDYTYLLWEGLLVQNGRYYTRLELKKLTSNVHEDEPYLPLELRW